MPPSYSSLALALRHISPETWRRRPQRSQDVFLGLREHFRDRSNISVCVSRTHHLALSRGQKTNARSTPQDDGQRRRIGSNKYAVFVSTYLFKAVRILTVFSPALLIYDFLICIDMEIRYVWQPSHTSRKFSRILYLYNRYIPLLYNVTGIIMIPPVSNAVSVDCHPLGHNLT